MPQPGLFELETVVVAQPKRSRWRRYGGPVLTLSTVEGERLAHVTHIDDSHWLITKTSGEFIAGITKRSRFGPFGAVRFHFTGTGNEQVGTAAAQGLVKTRQLSLQTGQKRPLLLIRRGSLSSEWHLARTDPQRGPEREILARVTVRTIDAWLGLQQYALDMPPPRLEACERRAVVASVVCLHLLRRPPAGTATPA